MPTGNVSIRLSIQDAETVRAALEKLGTDGAAALKKIDVASSHPSGGLNALDKGVAGAKTRLEELGQSLGPVGSLLMGLGPIGIAAAAGLGGALLVMHEMSKAANELGERAESLRNFAASAGVTTTIMQALTSEGSRFGVSGEQVAQGLQRLSVNLDQAKRGTGALYDDLHRINPELAHQVAAAKDVAQAYDLIGAAIRQANAAGNASGAAAIARAAFGRNVGGQANLAADVSSQGGVNSLAASYAAAGKALDEGLLKRLSELKNQIEQTNQRAKDIGASIFAEDTLQRALAMAQAMERMAQSAKELADATKTESWTDFFKRKLTELGAFGAGEGGNFELAGQMLEAARRQALVASARGRLAAGLQSGQQSNLDQVWQPAGRGGQSDAVTKVADAAKAAQRPIAEVMEETKKWMSILGSAATPAEQLKLKMLELDVAVKDHGAIAQVAARAREYLNDSDKLGIESTRERLGLATQEEILTARLIELKREEKAAEVTAGSPEDLAARQRVQRTAEQAFRQEQVNNSPFKGLAQMANPDLNSSLDQLGTSTLNNLDKTIVSLAMDTERGSVAWRQFGVSAIQAIEQMIVKMTLLRLASAGLSALFGGANGAAGPLASIFPHAMGGIMTSMGPLALNRYAGGGVATGPQLALFGEGRGPEAYVPLPDGRAIPVALQVSGGGGHTFNIITNAHMTPPAGTSPESAHGMTATFARQMKDMVSSAIDDRLVAHLRTGGLLNPA